MPRNKPRVHLALYARPKHPRSYHWALFVTPKDKSSTSKIQGPITKHHVKDTLVVTSNGEASQPWRYESITLTNLGMEQNLLAIITIAKVRSNAAVSAALVNVPVVQDGEGSFTCRTWMRDAITALVEEKVIATSSTHFLKWDQLEVRVREWIDMKKGEGHWSADKGQAVLRLDLITGKETVI